MDHAGGRSIVVDAAAPGGDRPRVLVLAHRVPYPPDKGDRIRTYQLLRWLSPRASIHLVCLADEPVSPDAMTALGVHCERVAVCPLGTWSRWARAACSLARGSTASAGAFSSTTVRRVVRRWAGEVSYRACLASASSLEPYLRMPCLRDVPSVVDVVDVDSQKWFDYAEASRGPRSWLYRLEGRRLRRVERSLGSRAKAVTLVSEAEAELFRRVCGPGPVHAITNGVDLDGYRPEFAAAGRGCVFVGALDYRANVDGLRWFCDEVWPEVRRRCPGSELRLVGRRPGPEVRSLAERPGVRLVGQVPDVRPYLDAAAVVVVPLRIARGVQNKVLEAMATGKPTVVSPQAMVGLRAEAGVHLLSPSSPGDWATVIVDLLGDEGLRRRVGQAGRRYVEEHHRWELCLAAFASLLDLEGVEPAAMGTRRLRPWASGGPGIEVASSSRT